jgi:DNA helicase INO80
VGFARTSDRNGPAIPLAPHPYIQEQDLRVCVQQPLLALPYHIFGSSPPLQSFDFAKMLIVMAKFLNLFAPEIVVLRMTNVCAL